MAENGNKPYKAHVLVLPFPAQGHINPMLQFCKRLASKGLKTTFVNTLFISSNTQPSASSLISTAIISDGYDECGFAGVGDTGSYLARFRSVGSETLSDLIKKLDGQDPRVDGLIYDPFLPWALDVAREFGLVGAAFCTQSCTVSNVYYHVRKGILKLPFEEGKAILVPGLPPLERSEAPSFVGDYGSYPALCDMLVNQFSNIDKADWVLFNTFYDLEEEVVDWMAKQWRMIRTIGPTIPSMYLDKQLPDDREYGLSLFKPKSTECMNWLNTKPANSVIYISFGSMAELETEQFEEIAWGLEVTDYSFLWVVRDSERSKLPEKLVDLARGEKGLLVTWSPQLEVLAHESVGCFVTHCGFNSVLETLSLGVPVVAVPQWTDQRTNAKYVEEVWGVGVRAGKDERGIVRREVLGECIREVMEGESAEAIKRNAVKWKKLAREAVGAGGSSDKNIDEFVAELMSKS
ncbi:UDP-glycosyltransferase 74G1-like [Rhododendron vialii]|uniref:UDP-glycosyltransferase 74G1-like n=1 Tax=Rhododendron vialii TaxID=182163 RepID=UPI0026604647|nr:UDP-glycosyltransferase 74G1-like [Rhododendron vialii]